MNRIMIFQSPTTAGFLAVASALLLAAGCSNQNPNKAAPVDAGKARSTLKLVLDAWKDGKAPNDMQANSPKVTVQDMDWLNGTTLKRYEMLDDGVERDANLECEVKLSLVDKQGKAVEKTVTYIVGTDPELTVFRKVVM